MNKKTTFKDVWFAFIKHLKQPKTIWDIKDRLLWFVVVIGGLSLLTWLVYNWTK